MISPARVSGLCLVLCVLAACSSESLEGDAAGGGASGGARDGGGDGGGGDGGEPSAAKGGSAGGSGSPSAPPELPDYTGSGCYGQVRETLVYDIETHVPETRAATCRGETERVRLYVSDELFETEISQAQVNGFLHRYELVGHSGSAYPELAVLPANERVFGAVDPTLLSSDKLPIFVVDTNRSGAGYLCGWCDGLELHLDGVQLSPLDGDTALSIAAHETFHLIHKSFDSNEEPWVDESLAQAAMSVNGYFSDRAELNSFARQPNVNWGPGADVREFDYGAGLAFGTFLWEFGGEELMRAATSNAANGWAGLDAALSAAGHPERAFEMFQRMAVALYLDDPERGFGFRSFDLVQKVGVSSASSGKVQPYGLVYYPLSEGASAVRLDGAASLRGLLFSDAEPVELLPVTIGEQVEASPGSVLVVTAESSAAVDYVISEL